MILGLIAILGLEYGWESVEWNKWHLCQRYLGLADGYASSAAKSRSMLRRAQAELMRLDAENVAAYADRSIPFDVTRKRDFVETHFLYRFAAREVVRPPRAQICGRCEATATANPP